jgi:hypothetical protein
LAIRILDLRPSSTDTHLMAFDQIANAPRIGFAMTVTCQGVGPG